MTKRINFARNLSIRVRVTLATLMIFSAFILLLGGIASHVLHDRMTEGIGLQQQVAAGLMATYVSENIAQRFSGLQRLGKKIDSEMLADKAALSLELQELGPDAHFFNAGVFVLNRQGEAIAAIPEDIRRVGVRYGDRDFFQQALISGKPAIGQPAMGRVLKSPVVAMAVPVKNTAGDVIAVLAGVIDLAQPNFFDEITDNKYGKTGYFLLIDRSSGMIVTSTNKRRIMEQLNLSDASPIVARHMAGEDVSGIGHNAMGTEILTSASSIPNSHWYVTVSLPTSEAFAPVREAEEKLLLMTALLGSVAALLTWLGIRRELLPLSTTLRKVDALMRPGAKLKPLPVHRSNEIGQLVTGFNHLIEEVAEREQKLKESEFRWMFAIEGSGNGLWDWNMQNDTVYLSRQWKAMLGYAEDEIDDSLDEWKRRIHPDDLDMVLSATRDYIEGKAEVYECEHRILRKDGECLWIIDRGVIVSRDEQQRPLRMIGTHTDITKRKAMEDQIRQLAFNDTLTGLPNRRLFHDRFDQAMRTGKRNGEYCALILVDLDNFKPLNDQYGHAAGDLLLIEVASRLKRAVRETDTVARLGGDEFVILLAQLGSDHALASRHGARIAEKARASIATPYEIEVGGRHGQVEYQCTASIGLVIFAAGDTNQEALLRQADARMYIAKTAGRNRVVESAADSGLHAT